ncbi:DNA-directed RNA polymerase subunit P [Candidatus Woesearchaeota archaeon]|nr:DNA-directed RNA polymerase subunit P [Candidatus Woesearchaeota archaeon]
MKDYKCFDCGKEVKQEYIRKKIRCPHCGGKILYKPQSLPTIIKAV